MRGSIEKLLFHIVWVFLIYMFLPPIGMFMRNLDLILGLFAIYCFTYLTALAANYFH